MKLNFNLGHMFNGVCRMGGIILIITAFFSRDVRGGLVTLGILIFLAIVLLGIDLTLG